MLKLRSFGVGVVVALAVPALALAATLDSNFHGHAVSSVPDADMEWTPGEDYTARLILDAVPSGAGEGPWYPFDPTKEYTAVLDAVVDTYSAGAVWFVTFDPGATVRVFEDTGTAADFQNPGTFTDGTEILTGTSNDLGGFGTSMTLGSIFGTVTFSAGAGLNLLDCTEPTVTLNDFVDTNTSVPVNYDENYDAKWDCDGTVTSVEDTSFGRVKATYR